MSLSASEVYHLTVDALRQVCSERGLDSSGPVRLLRQRLVDNVRANTMGNSEDEGATQASVPNDATQSKAGPSPKMCSHGGSSEGQTQVLTELLRQVAPLRSEEPGDILCFFTRVEEIHDLGLVNDSGFVTRILPLVAGSLLRFLGECLREGSGWGECKIRLLEEYFPHFVRERLIRDLIVFNFQSEGQSLRDYIEWIFRAAHFLNYQASEGELVDRILMNFHPSVSAHAAFLERPRSRRELLRVVGLVEERAAVARERERVEQASPVASGSNMQTRNASRGAPGRSGGVTSAPLKCWKCGRLGHLKRNCSRDSVVPGNGQSPGGRQAPRAGILNGLRKIAAVPRDAPLWVALETKVGQVPCTNRHRCPILLHTLRRGRVPLPDGRAVCFHVL